MTQDRATAPDDGIAARRAALHLIEQATGGQRLMSETIAAGALERLSPPDRARAQRLATQVLRQLPTADRALKPFLTKQPPLAVRNALRLGAVEIMEGAAAHGVVNAMVQIMSKGKRTQSYKGLVNAVLRKLAEQPPEAWARMPVPKLPNWLRGPMVEAWGRKPVEAMEAVQAMIPPLDLTPKGDGAALAEALGGDLLPTGSVRLREAGQVSALPGYDTGEWWVQDAATAIAARVLDARPGERVLDLCAAPGGKTMQLAAAGAQVTALDLSETRLGRLRENLARTGLATEVVQADALEFDASEAGGGFDAILLDAPCSATGLSPLPRAAMLGPGADACHPSRAPGRRQAMKKPSMPPRSAQKSGRRRSPSGPIQSGSMPGRASAFRSLVSPSCRASASSTCTSPSSGRSEQVQNTSRPPGFRSVSAWSIISA